MFNRRGCFLGVLFHSYLFTIRGFMGVLEDHDCESTILVYFWARGKIRSVKKVFLKHHGCGRRVECR